MSQSSLGTKIWAFLKELFTRNLKTVIEPLIIDPESMHSQEAESFDQPGRGDVTWRTLISSPQTKTDSLTAGIATCPPKTGHLCPHRHLQAEIYHIINGHGVVEIDGAQYPVKAGSVVYIPGDARHGIRNVDPVAELKWLYIFPTDGFGDVKYRFDEGLRK
ncbi:hypothetical protein LTR84_010691 [Exophiala bonariae]|uniref:Cupin type-2 domain-containing protein n=1 Tax=Exophiala bonariae TaxID=1690606 RepID=A0AAV9MSH9_9EURO|nr:hypothetical protein LTR84_010691 [Exophiala bonariae]